MAADRSLAPPHTELCMELCECLHVLQLALSRRSSLQDEGTVRQGLRPHPSATFCSWESPRMATFMQKGVGLYFMKEREAKNLGSYFEFNNQVAYCK